MRQRLICTTCGYVGSPKKSLKGSDGVELLLWVFFIIPGLIYSVWRSSSRYDACPKCKGQTMIPVNSPTGIKMLADQGKTMEQVNEQFKASDLAQIKRKKVLMIVIGAFLLFLLGIVIWANSL